uniref:VWFA domain-containing protein n=2 Tax=Ciona intestinalis TaxID=7719 RepID=F6QLY5_CIOIN
MLVADLQYKGFPINKYSYCTSCGMEDPVSSELTKPRVIVAISMSNDTVAMNPKVILHKIVQQAIEGMENVEVTLVTYGANDEFYPPYIRTINGRVSTTDLSDLETSISQMQFTGPSYDSSSTVSALEFIAENFHDCHKGVATSVVIVAPETMKQSMAGLLPGNLVLRITGELTQVNMISMLSNQLCTGFGLDVFSHTTGQCYLPSQVSNTVGDIVQHLSGNIGRSTLCSCMYAYPSEAALLTTCRFI